MKYRTLLDCIAPGVILEDIQGVGVLRSLLEKRMLLVYDTGLGKTFIASVFLRALLNENQGTKHIMVVLKDQDIQTPITVKSITGAPVLFTDASWKSISRFMEKWDRTNIFIVTYDCFRNVDFVSFLYLHLPDIKSFIIDEAHLVSNWNSSDTSWMIRALVSKIEYVLALTATPITSNKAQFPRLRNLVDRRISYRIYESMAESNNHEGYIQVNRKDYRLKGNYRTQIVWCDPMLHQVGKIKGNVFTVTKGTGARNQANKVIEVLGSLQNKKVIIYVHYHDSRLWLEKNLEEAGYKFASLHGKITNRVERKHVLDTFNYGEVNILITSITTALDISADAILFYEYTTLVKQMIGRPHRGLAPKDLDIYFFITKDTEELEFFSRYIYYRSLEIQTLLGKDYSEILSVGEELLKEIKEED